MRRSESKEKIVTAEELGLRDLPKSWSGGTLEQLSRSAEKVIEQSEAVGGSEDPRLPAARRILELKERSKKQTD